MEPSSPTQPKPAATPLAATKPMPAEAETSASAVEADGVRFWGNYMDVFNPVFPRGAAQIPGTDIFALLRSYGNGDKTRVEEVRQAQAYGLDGFQVWPTFAAAERWIDGLDRAGVSPDFKIMPQSAGVSFYKTYDDVKKALRQYLTRYGNNPRIARLHGTPLISSWGFSQTDTEIARLKRELAEEGLEFVWVPTLDRAFPPSLAYEGYDGTNCWFRDQYPEGIASNLRNAAKVGNGFTVFGTIRGGYDNGQRLFTHDMEPYRGMRTLLEGLDTGLDQGLREMILVTWNDISETAAYPSWATPYGFGEILQYYRNLYAAKPPANARAQVVVAYAPELLLGDALEVQFLLLPGRETGADSWRGQLRLEDENGRTVWEQPVELSGTAGQKPELVALTHELDLGGDIPAALSPVVTGPDGVAKRLAPINVRAGRLRTFRPLMIALDRIAPVEPAFEVQPQPMPGAAVDPVRVTYRVQAPEPIRQMQILDGMLALYDVRQPGDESRLFIGLDNWGLKEPVELKLQGPAQWLWHYHSSQDPALTVVESAPTGTDGAEESWAKSVEWTKASSVTVPIAVEKAIAVRRDTPAAVVALTAERVDGVTVEIASAELGGESSRSIPLRELFAGDVILDGPRDDTYLRVRLMEDGHILNRMPRRLGKEVLEGSALLPAVQRNEPYRVLSLAGELEDGSLFYSRPYVWVRTPAGERGRTRPVQVVRSGRSHDELAGRSGVDVSTNAEGWEVVAPTYIVAPRRPYTEDQVAEVTLPSWRVMDVNFPMKRGAGWMVGDSDSYMSVGWGWRSGVMDRPAGKWVGPGPEDSQWVRDDRLQRPVLQFSPTSRVSMRSRSGLAGSYTLEFDLQLDELGKVQRLVSDTMVSGSKGAMQMHVLADGRLKVLRDVTRQDAHQLVSTEKLTPGQWHHVRLLHDLKSLAIEIDGKPAGRVAVPPEIMRSHSVPFIGAVSKEKADGFSGRMANFHWQAGAGATPTSH